MTNEIIKQRLADQFPGIGEWDDTYGMLSGRIPAPESLDVASFLFHDPELQFQFLTDLTAVHYPDRKGEELCVVYHFHNLIANKRLRLKAYVPVEAPEVPSLTPLFAGANWMERETFDFFGVRFIGHPNLTRILNVDEMDYFPMRKEYPMEDPTRIDKDDEMFGRG